MIKWNVEAVAGTDRSHYQSPLSADLGRALAIHTHKLTDGDHYYEDGQYQSATTVARSNGIPVLGSYHMLHGRQSLANQAQWWFSRVNTLTPWWNSEYAQASGRAWVWQSDNEQFNYFVAPTVDEINGFGDLICSLAQCPAEQYLPYAPAWHYGAALKGLRYRNYWASNYGGNPAGDYRTVYPGNSSPRWDAAPIPALLLQYGSRTNIGDANAFRGTVNDLLTQLKAGVSAMAGVVIDLLNSRISGGDYDGWTVNNALSTILGRLPTNVAGQMVAILAAANHDPGVAATISPEAIALIAASLTTAVSDPIQHIADVQDKLVQAAKAASKVLDTP